MKILGLIHEVGETQQVSDTYKKRDLIVKYETNPQYPEFIKFETNQERVSLFDGLKIGDEVEVHFNIKGRPWVNPQGVTIYFNSLIAWKIDKTNSNTPPPVDISNGNGDDDLPF